MPTFGQSWQDKDLQRIASQQQLMGPGSDPTLRKKQTLVLPDNLVRLNLTPTQIAPTNVPIPALESPPRPVVLLIKPRPAERPRFSKFHGAYNSKAYSDYKHQVVELLKAKIAEGEIDPTLDYAAVEMAFRIPVPKSWTKKATLAAHGTPHRKKFDVDNGIKGVLDAMTEAGVFPDDGQIAYCSGHKWYVREGQEPRIEFTLLTYDQLLRA